MNSGGMKFSVFRGLVASSVLSCIAGAFCIGQLSADESGKPVRFKLSDTGDSGKVIVVEKSLEKQSVTQVIDNGLRFKRDEEGNIHRIGDFKEVAPLSKQESVKTPNAKPTVEKTVQTKKESESSNVLFPELPSLDTLFPTLDWSGFDDTFDGFLNKSNTSAKRNSAVPGLKIKTAPPKTKSIPAASAPATEVPAKVDSPSEKISENNPEKETAVAEIADKEKSVDTVTGLPMLADIELMDLNLGELGLPKLELPNLNLFFGTSSEPLVDGNGEVPEKIEQQSQVEEPLQEAIEDMVPMDSPMEDVIEKGVESEDEVAKKRASTEQASNTSVLELPAADPEFIDALDEFFGSDEGEVSRSKNLKGSVQESEQKTAISQAAENGTPIIHRAPNRKNVGMSKHKASRPTTTTGSVFDLFSEFKIPEFNNPFNLGSNDATSGVEPPKPAQIPGLKMPTPTSPDQAILESLPQLDSSRPNVPGLKLMRTKAPTNVPMVDSEKTASEEEISKDDMELGSGVSAGSATEKSAKKLVDPDKILDKYKEEE